MDELFHRFEDSREIDGELVVNSTALGRCMGRVVFNQYNTNGMQIDISELPDLKIPGLPEKPTNEEIHALDVKVVESHSRLTRWASFPASYLFLGSLTGNVAAPVHEYGWRQISRSGSPERMYFKYCFPLTTVAMSRGGGVMDELHGFYHGEIDRESESVKMSKDYLKLHFLGHDVTIFEKYGNHEIVRRGKYPTSALVRQSCLSFSLEVLGQKTRAVTAEANGIASQLLTLISFLEQNRIRWTSEEIDVKSDSEWTESSKRYRWESPPSEKYEASLATLRGTRESLIVVSSAFEELSEAKRDLVIDLLRNFEVANCSEFLETKLIFWYACLDRMLKKLLKVRGATFSARLVKACDNLDLHVFDLIEREVFDYWRDNSEEGKSKFDFVESRNTFVHEGPWSKEDQILPLSTTVRNVRALAERMIMASLGLSHEGLSFGQPTLTR